MFVRPSSQVSSVKKLLIIANRVRVYQEFVNLKVSGIFVIVSKDTTEKFVSWK